MARVWHHTRRPLCQSRAPVAGRARIRDQSVAEKVTSAVVAVSPLRPRAPDQAQ